MNGRFPVENFKSVGREPSSKWKCSGFSWTSLDFLRHFIALIKLFLLKVFRKFGKDIPYFPKNRRFPTTESIVVDIFCCRSLFIGNWYKKYPLGHHTPTKIKI